jgi:DNA ligase-1
MIKTLYKKDTKDRIQQWSIELNNDSFRTIEGLVDGKLTTSNWTICESKNIGKANSTSGSEQSLKEFNAKVKKKLETGYHENIEDCDKESSFIKPMLAKSFNDYRDEVILNLQNYAVQPKLDGIRCIATLQGLFTRNGKPILNAEHILKDIQQILINNPDIIALDGELYNHEFKNDFNKIVSLVKKIKPTKEEILESEKYLQYHVYDLVMKGNFSERTDKLYGVSVSSNIIMVQSELPASIEDLDNIYAKFIQEGYEGQMIRNIKSEYQYKRTKDLLKRKEFIDDEFEIIDVLEGIGNNSGMAGSLKLKTKANKEFNSNIKGNIAFFTELLINKESIIGKEATIRYQNLTPDGIPRFPVCLSIRDYE